MKTIVSYLLMKFQSIWEILSISRLGITQIKKTNRNIN